jgi:polyisoprenoid-binding protein YceI
VLIDVLTEQHFETAHIPGAVNACVYEIAFLESIAKLAPSQQTALVVYGLNDQFQAAAAAFEQLSNAGYSSVSVLQGGLEAWIHCGLPVQRTAGESVATTPARRPLDTERSVIYWTGRNLVNHHTGKLAVTGGYLEASENGLTAAVVTTHFETLECTDIPDQKMNKVLLDHLKAADFFLASEFPEASFVLSDIEAIEGSTPGRPNCRVKGDLNLRGVSRNVEFEAVFDQGPEQWVVQASLEIDRTRWNSRYGSGRFFEALGKHLVNDYISLQIQLFAVQP